LQSIHGNRAKKCKEIFKNLIVEKVQGIMEFIKCPIQQSDET
jgi:hypothetical protein